MDVEYFKGFDIGCGHCACVENAIKIKHCKRGELHNYKACGTHDENDMELNRFKE